MAVYTLNTSADQESLLSWVVKQYNLEHDSALTNDQYVQMRFPQLLTPFKRQYQDHLSASINTNFAAADAATQQQVLSLLKVQ